MTSMDNSRLPWSYRTNAVVRGLISLLAGAGCGLIGTFAHRLGAPDNIPYGLVLAFAILSLSTWAARARCGIVGAALHMISSSGVAWLIAAMPIGGDVLTPAGFNIEVPFFSEHAGYIWLYGIILVEVAFVLMPASWFAVRAADTAKTNAAQAAAQSGPKPERGELPRG